MSTFDNIRRVAKTSALVFCLAGLALAIVQEQWPTLYAFLVALLCVLESVVITEWKIRALARAEALISDLETRAIGVKRDFGAYEPRHEAELLKTTLDKPRSGFA